MKSTPSNNDKIIFLNKFKIMGRFTWLKQGKCHVLMIKPQQELLKME